MTGRTFLDTNVPVYAVDTSEPAKRRTALDVLRDTGQDFVVSAQVLSEFYVVVTRRLAEPLSVDVALESLRELAQLPTVPLDVDLVLSAAKLSRESRLSLWDAQILHAAQLSGCDRLLSEDFSDGAVYGSVRVENPFRGPQ